MMKYFFILWSFILPVLSFSQTEQTPKAIPSKSAAFYHPLIDNKLVSGQWIGEVYKPVGLDLNLTHGTGTFAISDSKTNETLLRFKGNTINGIWDGYIYYFEKSDSGSLFIEGEFKAGLPHGKIICCINNKQYLAGKFHYGFSYHKVSLNDNSKTVSTFCNGFDLFKFIKTDTTQLQHCARETKLDDPLYGGAIMISRIANVSDKHSSIEKFLECMRLNEVEVFVQSPDNCQAGATVIQSILNNPFWKDFSVEEIQELIKTKLKEQKLDNLSGSLEYVSFLSCLIEECRKW